mgnify:FL=1|tara:strand:+ start:541 stop:1509 length:969 start_codon:yes stop_codon:yes gene_type:complete
MDKINIAGTTNLEVTPESENLTVGNISATPEATPFESTDSYDNISIPGELLGEQPQEQSTQEETTEQAETTESTQTAETQSATEENQTEAETEEQTNTVSTESEDNSDDSFVYEDQDGSKFSTEDIELWRTDSVNRHEWQKSNTEKAQQLSDQRRAVEPLVQLVDKLKESGEFSETLKEAIEDELGKEAGQLYEQSLQMDNKDLPNPYESELTEAREKLETIESERELERSMSQLRSTYELNDTQVQEVLDFAVSNFEKTDRVLTLEEAYKVMNFNKAPAPEPKPKPSVPVNVKKNVGIKADTNKKASTYEDIDVASFFNNQ